jgi:hypothetical protein
MADYKNLGSKEKIILQSERISGIDVTFSFR